VRPVDVAVRLSSRGLAVVPLHTPIDGSCSCNVPGCPAPGKHPKVRWRDLLAGPPSLDDVRSWWARWPDANVGVLTGRVSGVVVLDIDPRNGGDTSVGTLERTWGPLPSTPTVRTGGGGRHLWFVAPGAPVTSGPVAPGLDLKGEGGLVVAPPSLHASGDRYAWIVTLDDVELAPLPVHLVEAGAGRPAPGLAGGRRGEPPLRTPDEQADFAAAWARAGVTVVPGDHRYLCPFHDDHHPSLHVDAEGCRWYCFGCGRGGGAGALHHQLGDEPRSRLLRRVRAPALRTAAVATLVGDVEVDVVGESFHQDALLALTGGRRSYGGASVPVVAELRPDPDDPVDAEAVAVLVDGRRVGWMHHDDGLAWRATIERAIAERGTARCHAVIRGGWDRGHGDVGAFGVVLLLPPP